jgi:uncharacterized repeat protein (TIGR01451 family)
MHSRSLDRLYRIFLVVSLLAGLSFTTGAAAAPLTLPGSADKTGPALQPLGVSATGATFPPITIPATTATVDVNGTCDANEYGLAAVYTFTDIGSAAASVRLMHDNTYLYVCLVAPHGSYPTRFASLYLDPQGNGISYQFAQQYDYSLRVKIVGPSLLSMAGSGVANGYVPLNSPGVPDYWTGAATGAGVNDKNDVVEYRVNLKDFGLGICGSIFGLSVFHHWVVGGSGDDYGWPSTQWFDQPRTWQLATLSAPVGSSCGANGTIAYVFRGNTQDATSFYNTLVGAGYSVTLVPLSSVMTTDFNAFSLVMIADDTGSLDQWGTPGLTDQQVAKIANPNPGKANKPILGLGEGGYAFFGRLSMFIGWPHGWHGPQINIREAATPPAAIYVGVSVVPPNPIPFYIEPTNSVGIYTPTNPALPANVTKIGLEDPLDDHSSLIQEGCQLLWGNSGNPLGMTTDGTTIFLNSVGYILSSTCELPPVTPSGACYSISKTASPDPTAVVHPGDMITYTITYQLKTVVGANCPTQAKLVDVVPTGTTYVPNSASDSINADPGGVLTWLVGTSAAPLTKKFSVIVSNNVCAANDVADRVVDNAAELHFTGAPPEPSTTVSNPITCPPVGLPTDQPVFAETELKVEPYPLVSGTPTKVSVQVQNLTSSSIPVTVQFQIDSVNKFGIGLPYTTAANASATLPASGMAVLVSYFTPTFSGNACIQAAVSTTGMTTPLLTQSCLDVTEDLTNGIPAFWDVPVRNNTGSTADVLLVIDNTCPGWTATVTNPADGTIHGLGAGAFANPKVRVTVTPPTSGLLGSGCHIDLQAWIGTTMIGGVRKLDVAPVHLPLNVQPPWEESEITVHPDPASPGVPAQLCIQLVNPLATAQDMIVDFAVADFGAGVPFIPTVSLPIHALPGIHTYCVAWTPSAGGTLHRCILATLKQDGYIDQTSQHNIELVSAPPATGLSGMSIPFVVGNPDLVSHTLTFHIDLLGIGPVWMPVVETGGGGTLIPPLAGGGEVTLQLVFPTLFAPAEITAPPVFTFGGASSVQVTYLLDDVPAGGFTIIVSPLSIYLPVMRK